MTTEPTSPNTDSTDNPVADFSNCHIGIIKNFEQLRDLAIIEVQNPVQTEVKHTADKLCKFFRDVVMTHHEEEEHDEAEGEEHDEHAEHDHEEEEGDARDCQVQRAPRARLLTLWRHTLTHTDTHRGGWMWGLPSMSLRWWHM